MIHERRVPMYENIAYFLLSIVINALGNALTVSINLGSALWTASSVNMTYLTGIPVGTTLFGFGVLVMVINALILRRIEWQRLIGNLIFLIPFSYLVGLTSQVFLNENINTLPVVFRILLDCTGVVLIAMAISIYQRVNLMLHPCDDLMQIIRFKYFKGSAAIAQLVTFAPPVLIILFCWFQMGQLYAINVGTIFALAFQGPLVGIFDRIVFPALKHQHLEHINA
ncbi:YczE/YyaS/YitT family protein [Sporolactobacillus spathodeae]|uniref:Membrane protein YczE n=1 Tax=Sporolactobacillus spathodeae TaxID=1465502 RepID=A0ABS2Q7A6_9BACL|nr:hypothetical protein [Sporolactobacillus spathodeae]MBM7657683.1 putative membrane protein YczE [Sporolactobacillus spathodeae]